MSIKKLRTEQKLSQQKLAELTGLSVSFISKVESGRISSPSLHNLGRIYRALGLTEMQLVNELIKLLKRNIDNQ